MAKHERNKVDLINAPVELARSMSAVQVDAFKGQFLPEPANPIKRWMAQNGIRIKDLM